MGTGNSVSNNRELADIAGQGTVCPRGAMFTFCTFSPRLFYSILRLMIQKAQDIAPVAQRANLTIEYRQIAELIPDPRNARTHPERQIEQLKSAITSFGFTNPILIDEAGVLIAGHGRLRAARDLGLYDVPTITLAGLGDAEKRALRLADNKIALGAGWDLDLLKLELGELATLDVDLDLTLTGFSMGEIDVILADTPDPDDEVLPAIPENPRTRPGNIWELGDHRIGCGDARDPDFLRLVIGAGEIDAAFLDPPYNVAINGHANSKGRHREFAMASGEMSTSEFQTFLADTLGASAEV